LLEIGFAFLGACAAWRPRSLFGQARMIRVRCHNLMGE
jgi:hypothetical protein